MSSSVCVTDLAGVTNLRDEVGDTKNTSKSTVSPTSPTGLKGIRGEGCVIKNSIFLYGYCWTTLVTPKVGDHQTHSLEIKRDFDVTNQLSGW